MFNRYLLGPLFNEADPDGANGGGEGGDTGHEPKEGEEQQPQALTTESLMALLKTALPEMMKPLLQAEVSNAVGPLSKELKALKKKNEPPAAPAPTGGEEFSSPRERELKERLDEIERSRREDQERANQRELDAEIKLALADFPWADPDKKQVAFDYYKAKAARNEDNELVIGEKPLSLFIKSNTNSVFSNFMQVRQNVGGSGNATNRGGAPKGVGLETIKSNMSADEDRAVRAAILAAYNDRQKQVS